MDVTDEELKPLYQWVDEIPLSRPKRNIARDFADGVLVAEAIAHFFPRLVELHNYSSANSLSQKMYNWNTLNAKVLKRLGFSIPRQDCEDISNTKPGSIERVLKLVKFKMAKFQEKHGITGSEDGEHDGPGGIGGASGAGSRLASSPQHQQQSTPQQHHPQQPQQQPQPQHNPLESQHPHPTTSTSAPATHQHHQNPHQPHHQHQYQHPHSAAAASNVPNVTHVPRVPNDPNLPEQSIQKVPGNAVPHAALEHRGQDAIIDELRETNEILETKARKLEQLVRLKDAKIQTLLNKLQAMGAQ